MSRPACLRDVAEAPVAVVLVEPVRQAARLADVDLVEAVAVDIRGGDSVLAVDVDSGGRVEARAPVRERRAPVVAERRVAAERVARDVAKPGSRSKGQRLLDRLKARIEPFVQDCFHQPTRYSSRPFVRLRMS